MASAGISGMGVAIATAGGLFVYAGFKGIGPIAALRQVSSGTPTGVTSSALDLGVSVGTAALAQTGADAGLAAGSGATIVAAAQKYTGDKYSQIKRTQPGWSDCSSFVDKALRDAGISPPGDKWANSTMYRLSSTWRTIPASQAQPGDVAVSSHHIVLVTGAGGSSAIGQQNPRVNVRTGSVANLMTGQSYVYKTRRSAGVST